MTISKRPHNSSSDPVLPVRKHAISFEGCKRLTESHHKDKCDVHRIDSVYRRTGLCDHLKPSTGLQFRDMTQVPDFQTAMNVIAESKSAFQRLPAALRAKFDNNPDKFVAYVHDPRNEADLIALGVASEKVKPSPSATDLLSSIDQKLSASPTEGDGRKA